MSEYKNDLRGLSAAELRSRRDRLAVDLPRAAQFLAGSLVEQRRRCGKEGCRCTRGELHGPYVYLSFSLPVTIVILRPFMRAIPGELEDAATVDGAPGSGSSCGSWWRCPGPR
jgi:hypothetical protein